MRIARKLPLGGLGCIGTKFRFSRGERSVSSTLDFPQKDVTGRTKYFLFANPSPVSQINTGRGLHSFSGEVNSRVSEFDGVSKKRFNRVVAWCVGRGRLRQGMV